MAFSIKTLVSHKNWHLPITTFCKTVLGDKKTSKACECSMKIKCLTDYSPTLCSQISLVSKRYFIFSLHTNSIYDTVRPPSVSSNAVHLPCR
jgi:hypothetical protein